MNDNSGEKFLYFLIGGFVGASVALLFAPKSGQETRELIAGRAREGAEFVGERGRQAADYVGGGARDAQAKATGYVDRGKEVLSKQKEQLAAAIEAGKQAYREEKGKLGRETATE